MTHRILKSVLNFQTLAVTLLLSTSVFAQGTIKGRITETKSGEPIFLANVSLESTQIGATTNISGNFIIPNIPEGTYIVKASYLGFTTVEKQVEITTGKSVFLTFSLQSEDVELGEVLIEANKARERETPVAFSELKAQDIKGSLGDKDISMVLNTLPSVYATETGGGPGDSRISIRGFDQNNIAVMINGVPVNDMENSKVYWSNWAGLGEVARNIQVQRGLGATPYSVSSVGGLINIQTVSTDASKSTRIKFETGSNHYTKKSAAFSTGLLENGLAVSGLVSHKTTDGFADRTWLDEFTYFLTIGKKFENQTLDFTVIGSPQKHGQRNSKLTKNEWSSRGLDYNAGWGMLNGKEIDLAVNYYHKPAMNLNHNWQIKDDMMLATIIYASFGTGGGTGAYGTNAVKKVDGTLDFDGLWTKNTASTTGSVGILRSSRNDHNWYGFLSTLKFNVDENTTLSAGVDARYYRGIHFREITNLLGGSYFLNSSDKNRDPKTKLNVGDKIDYSNDGLVYVGGGFGQAEYKTPDYSVFLNVAGNITSYKRIDYFKVRDANLTVHDFNSTPDSVANYYSKLASLDPLETDWVKFPGYNLKLGSNLNLDDNQNIFINIGNISKAPFFDVVFKTNNTQYPDTKNEKIYAIEGGYGYRSEMLAVELNGFLTWWEDKTMSLRGFDSVGAEYRAIVPGMSAFHRGAELNIRYILNENLEINSMLSLSKNVWNTNVTDVEIRNDGGQTIDSANVYAKDVYVGDFPMTSASFSLTYQDQITDNASITFKPVLNYFDRMYARFDPESRSKKTDQVNSWKLPAFSVVNIFTSYNLQLSNLGVQSFTFGFNIYNAMNSQYISDADDGTLHDAATAKVFYGAGRTYVLSAGFNF
ncbi:MAG: TonB-dependent receptor [Bacteroidetes bacterium]|nr:TonB-dependent receptor [Bacteroidota bacterium]